MTGLSAATARLAVATTRAELAAARARLSGPVVLVPTMGALHSGHRSLLQQASEIAGPSGSVVVSIFVNPRQFGPAEDLDRYPRTLDDDLAVCAGEGVALVFAPPVTEVYPAEPMVTVDPGPVGRALEGEFRPGFFGGVLTVVLKLFALTRPDVAVFGQKDAQQLALVRQMSADFNLGVEVRPVPTFRDPDGLAASSRNRYLSAGQRAVALALPAALQAGLGRAGDGPQAVLATARDRLDAAPLTVDYLALVDAPTFAPAGPDFTGTALLLVAARVGSTRLIDNVIIGFGPSGPGE
ncbi:MAG TPA: pantoate--beta-alanine ligase [Streptosporangiaceae bacterium]|nr:pantoate--beta-alanine ligase [Streptosporangiaceae bacterium]